MILGLCDLMGVIYREESYAIMGACFGVYREKGCGLIEPVYHECLEYEFQDRRVPAIHEPRIEMEYKGRLLKNSCEPDFLCYGKIVLELKSVKALNDAHRAQVFNYLRATGYKLGLLVNFGHFPQIEYERIILDPKNMDL